MGPQEDAIAEAEIVHHRSNTLAIWILPLLSFLWVELIFSSFLKATSKLATGVSCRLRID